MRKDDVDEDSLIYSKPYVTGFQSLAKHNRLAENLVDQQQFQSWSNSSNSHNNDLAAQSRNNAVPMNIPSSSGFYRYENGSHNLIADKNAMQSRNPQKDYDLQAKTYKRCPVNLQRHPENLHRSQENHHRYQENHHRYQENHHRYQENHSYQENPHHRSQENPHHRSQENPHRYPDNHHRYLENPHRYPDYHNRYPKNPYRSPEIPPPSEVLRVDDPYRNHQDILIHSESSRTPRTQRIHSYELPLPLKAPEFDNKYTRLKINKDVLVRTGDCFMNFFTANSHLARELLWEKEIIARRPEYISQNNQLWEKEKIAREPEHISQKNQFYRNEDKDDLDSDVEILDVIKPKPHIIDITSVKIENNYNTACTSKKSEKNEVFSISSDTVLTEDNIFNRRCRRFLRGKPCSKEKCNYLHSYPKDENIFCKKGLSGECPKSSSECWYKHESTTTSSEEVNVEKSPNCSRNGNEQGVTKIRSYEYEEMFAEECEALENRTLGRTEIRTNVLKNQPTVTAPTRSDPPKIVDTNSRNRCRTFMRRGNCSRGSECNYLHTLPKEDNILCRDFEMGTCERTAVECKFKHTACELVSNADEKESSCSAVNKDGEEDIERSTDTRENENRIGVKMLPNAIRSEPVVTVKETFDDKRKLRCRQFMRKGICSKGSNCKFRHKLPKDDNILCKDYMKGNCERAASECQFKHGNGENESNVTVDKINNSQDNHNDGVEEKFENNDSLAKILQHLRMSKDHSSIPMKSKSKTDQIMNVSQKRKWVTSFDENSNHLIADDKNSPKKVKTSSNSGNSPLTHPKRNNAKNPSMGNKSKDIHSSSIWSKSSPSNSLYSSSNVSNSEESIEAIITKKTPFKIPKKSTALKSLNSSEQVNENFVQKDKFASPLKLKKFSPSSKSIDTQDIHENIANKSNSVKKLTNLEIKLDGRICSGDELQYRKEENNVLSKKSSSIKDIDKTSPHKKGGGIQEKSDNLKERVKQKSKYNDTFSPVAETSKSKHVGEDIVRRERLSSAAKKDDSKIGQDSKDASLKKLKSRQKNSFSSKEEDNLSKHVLLNNLSKSDQLTKERVKEKSKDNEALSSVAETSKVIHFNEDIVRSELSSSPAKKKDDSKSCHDSKDASLKKLKSRQKNPSSSKEDDNLTKHFLLNDLSKSDQLPKERVKEKSKGNKTLSLVAEASKDKHFSEDIVRSELSSSPAKKKDDSKSCHDSKDTSLKKLKSRQKNPSSSREEDNLSKHVLLNGLSNSDQLPSTSNGKSKVNKGAASIANKKATHKSIEKLANEPGSVKSISSRLPSKSNKKTKNQFDSNLTAISIKKSKSRKINVIDSSEEEDNISNSGTEPCTVDSKTKAISSKDKAKTSDRKTSKRKTDECSSSPEKRHKKKSETTKPDNSLIKECFVAITDIDTGKLLLCRTSPQKANTTSNKRSVSKYLNLKKKIKTEVDDESEQRDYQEKAKEDEFSNSNMLCHRDKGVNLQLVPSTSQDSVHVSCDLKSEKSTSFENTDDEDVKIGVEEYGYPCYSVNAGDNEFMDDLPSLSPHSCHISNTAKSSNLSGVNVDNSHAKMKTDAYGLPLKSSTTREDLLYLLNRLPSFGVKESQTNNEIYNVFTKHIIKDEPKCPILENDISDKLILIEANFRIYITYILNYQESSNVKENLLQHWSKEKDLRNYKNRLVNEHRFE